MKRLHLEVDQHWEAGPPELPVGEAAELPLVLAPHKCVLSLLALLAQHHLQGVLVKHKLHTRGLRDRIFADCSCSLEESAM